MGNKSEERPRNRRRDEVLKDIRILSVKKWTKMVMDRSVWHDPVEKSKASAEL
jgi:hypothetical protein